MQTEIEDKLQRHVTFCAQGQGTVFQSGRQAELDTVQLLVDNLNTRSVGDYRILVNYNMPLRGRGSIGTLESDLVVINRFGVFVLEVKDWRGVIDAYDSHWLQSHRHEHDNVFVSINDKARSLHSSWFKKRGGKLSDLGKVSVLGLIVLARGKRSFFNHSNFDDRVVINLDPVSLQEAVGFSLVQGLGNRVLADEEILRIRDALYEEHEETRDVLIGDYRIVGELSPGDLFEAFEAVNVNIETQRVRIKRYRLDNISGISENTIDQFKRSAEAVSMMGYHPNILHTVNFFPDPNRPDVFYEVTEFIMKGDRLDEIMAQCNEHLALGKQLDYIESLGVALMHAHEHNVYHRNLNPETVFVTGDDVVKLADFDFAKILGKHTITRPGQVLVDTPMTAPELSLNPSAASPASDIYSLGALWYFLASLPEKESKLTPERIDDLELPREARELMKTMLTKAVKRRPQRVECVLEQLRMLRKEIR
jgi:hypothetical protein